MSERKQADWEAIELAFRAGALSVREIAKQHGVSHEAIRKRAKAHGWARDLSAKVRKEVATQLVATQVATVSPATERAVVEETAGEIVKLIREHRTDIRRLRETGGTLWEQLVDAIGNRELIELAIHEETAVAPDAPGYVKAQADAQRKAMLKAVSLPSHVACLKDLANVMKALVPLERQAFNVDAQPDTPADPAAVAGAASAATLASIEAFGEALAKRVGAA